MSENIGDLLRKRRRTSLGKTAQTLGLSTVFLGKIERGIAKLPPARFPDFMAAYGLTESDLEPFLAYQQWKVAQAWRQKREDA